MSMADLTGSVVGFAQTLRAAGVDASPERVHAFLDALSALGATERGAVYWAGRVTLCGDPDDLDRYDRVFAAFFDGAQTTARTRSHRRVRLAPGAVSSTPATGGTPEEEGTELRAVTRSASRIEQLRHRDIADLTEHERRDLDLLLAAFALPGELRRTRRRTPGHRGAIDRRRTLRAMMAAGGEPGRLAHEVPRDRPRPVVLLVDVSGSMAGYADALLRFAHAASRRREGRTEVFTLGTRLTRVTEELAHRDADTAMRAVSVAIPDWEGGTRLGETLRTFLDRWGQRGMARGAVAVVLSDGWETGDAQELGEQVARLSRLAHRLIWANPRAARPGFAPTAAGMAAALPWCDQLVEGHSLGALEELARTVAGAQRATSRAGQRRRTVVVASATSARATSARSSDRHAGTADPSGPASDPGANDHA
jgi:uncharacterized protein